MATTSDKDKDAAASKDAAKKDETQKTPATKDQAVASAVDAGPGYAVVKAEAVTTPPAEEKEPEEAPDKAASDNVFDRAEAAGIGLIDPLGLDSRYVGQTPMLEDEEKRLAPDGAKIGKFTFRPLREVAFDPSLLVKDPASGKFYLPTGCTSWADCNMDGAKLIPDKTGGDGGSKSKDTGSNQGAATAGTSSADTSTGSSSSKK